MNKMTIVTTVLLAATAVQADWTYTYGPGTNFGMLTLYNNESLLVNGGQGGTLGFTGSSYARIESTTPLGSHINFKWKGGIGGIDAAGSSRLEILGGEIYKISVMQNSHAWLYGGRIDVFMCAPHGAYTPHTDLFCKSYLFNSGTAFLTGIWGDDSSFSIYLMNPFNAPGTATYDNITFHIIPEPLTLAMLGFGGLVLRHGAKRRVA